MLAAPSGVGPFPLNWIVEAQGLVHVLPGHLRNWLSMRSLRPGSSAWLMPQFQGVRVHAGRQVLAAAPVKEGISLRLDQGSATFDHVLLATGYKIDIARLGLLTPTLLQGIKLVDGAPVLAGGFEANVPGLHFVGGSAVWSYGPLMRFVCGAGYAARKVTASVRRTKQASRKSTRPLRTVHSQA